MGSRLLCIFDFMFELDVLVENNPIPAVLLQPADRFLWIFFFLYSFYPQPSQAFQSTTTAKLLEPLCSQLGNMPFWRCAAFLSRASLRQPNILIFGIIKVEVCTDTDRVQIILIINHIMLSVDQLVSFPAMSAEFVRKYVRQWISWGELISRAHCLCVQNICPKTQLRNWFLFTHRDRI